MPAVGFNTFFPKSVDTVFVVENITSGRNKKTVKLFNYPIPPGRARDLLDIPEVSEADIRHSLLKGELKVKAQAGEIRISRSTIDLLQFDPTQLSFLESIGVSGGLQAGSATTFAFKQGIDLVGAIDGSNTIFTVPSPDKFINGTFGVNTFAIDVKSNGRSLVQGVDFTVSESGGVGTGYDTVTIVSFVPSVGSTMQADYVVQV